MSHCSCWAGNTQALKGLKTTMIHDSSGIVATVRGLTRILGKVAA